MNHDYEQTEFSKSLLSGVFAGISAVVIGLLFNFSFRASTGFPLSEIINISTIIFSLLILLTIAGLIFYLFHHYFKKGTIIFQAAGFAATLVLLAGSMSLNRSTDPILSMEFREMLYGLIIITGISVVFIIPFLFKHDYI